MKVLYLFVVVGLMCAPLVSEAQWTQTGGPEGGSFRAATVTPNGVVATVSGQGTYLYNNSSWMRIGDIGPNRLLTTGSTLLGVGGPGGSTSVYRSEDNGRTWSPVDVDVTSTEQMSVVGETVYVVQNDTLYKSTDGLQSMGFVGATPQFARSPVGGDGVLVLAAGFFGEALYRSVDGGATWTVIEGDIPFGGANGNRLVGNENVLFLDVALRDVYRSTDDGETWDNISAGLPENLRIDWLVTNDGIPYLTNNAGGMLRYDGTTWVEIDVPGVLYEPAFDGQRALVPTSVGIFSVSPDDAVVTSLSDGIRAVRIDAMGTVGPALLVGASAGTYRTLNDGQTWEQVADFYPTAFVSHENTIFASTSDDIWRSTDRGETWVSMQTKFDAQKIERWGSTDYPLPFSDVAVADDGTLYIALAESFHEHQDGGWRDGGIFRSDDNGETWTEVSDGLPDDGFTYVPVSGILTADDGTVFIGTADGIYRSASRGRDWSRSVAGLPLEGANVGGGQLSLLNGQVYLINVGRLFRFEGGTGGSWQPVADPPDGFSVSSFTGSGVNVVQGKRYTRLSKWNGAEPEYRTFAFDGSDWEDISDQMPEGVALQVFVQKGDKVFGGSVGRSVWVRSLAPSSVDASAEIAADVTLTPNPFVSELTIQLHTDKPVTSGKITVANMLGDEIAVLYEGSIPSGDRDYRFDVSALPSGPYVVRMELDNASIGKAVVKRR